MVAPESDHLVVVSDMTGRVSEASWDDSLQAARRRGGTRSQRGTRSAVLIAGPSERWLLDRLSGNGDLADVAVPLRRIDSPSLKAWDRIRELDVGLPARQARLLAVTGGWPLLVEQVLVGMRQRPFDDVVASIEAHLATTDGARELVAAVGLDPEDADQPADAELVRTFGHLVRSQFRETPSDLAAYIAMDDDAVGITDPAGAVEALILLGALSLDDDGLATVEPVLADCFVNAGVEALAI